MPGARFCITPAAMRSTAWCLLSGVPMGVGSRYQGTGQGSVGMFVPSGVMRSACAVALLCGLAACGGNTGRSGPTASYGSATRSYDPPGPPSDPWGPYIREASRRFDVPDRWIREVMRQESGGRATATSPVGAMGLMQVMPGTYRELQSRYALGDDPYHPYDSIMAGTAYIREMYDLYGSPAFLAAYNAGPRRLENYLYNRAGLPNETRNYVARIGPGVLRASPVRRAPPEVYAAAELPVRVPSGPRRMDSATMVALQEQRDLREQNARYARLPDPEPATPILTAARSTPSIARPVAVSSGAVVAMEPIPDGSTPGGQQAMAESAARSGTSLAGYDQPPAERRVIAAAMEPIPDGSTPEGAAALAESASRQTITNSPSGPLARPVYTSSPARANGPTLAAAASPRRFGLIGSAQAATPPQDIRPVVANASASWAVQVGAFSDERQARTAADAVGGGRVQVQPVRVGRSTLYRARIVGMTQGGAQQACGRVRGPCIVLSPDAQG